MSKIDEFESVFKSAAKPVFHIEPLQIKYVLIVVDLEQSLLSEYIDRVSKFLSALNSIDNSIEITIVDGGQFDHVQQLLDICKGHSADLVCTYRNIHGSSIDYPYSLGEYVDVLTQVVDIPVLLLPRPEDLSDDGMKNTDCVMLMTDHLAGDNRLVTYGAMFTEAHGELILTHVEDEMTFERYIQVIGKIQDIDTDVAREEIMQQLLKEPADFIESCQTGLQEAGLLLEIKPIVTVGHHLSDYKKLVAANQVDLLVMNTKDDDQLAMHGLAYPVSVEIRNVPLLLI